MVFMGRGFTFRGEELGSVFSAAVCKIQASKRYIVSLPLVLVRTQSLSPQEPAYKATVSAHHGIRRTIDGFQMSIKRPTSGGQTHDQEAAVQRTFYLESHFP